MSPILFRCTNIEDASNISEKIVTADVDYNVTKCVLYKSCPNNINDTYYYVMDAMKVPAAISNIKGSVRGICRKGRNNDVCSSKNNNNILLSTNNGFQNIYIFGEFDPRIGVKRDNIQLFESKNSTFMVERFGTLTIASPLQKGERNYWFDGLIKILNKILEENDEAIDAK